MIGFLIAILTAVPPPPVVKAEIVVTPERGATERDAVAASVSVVTREQLDAMPAHSLAEVVNAVPGVTMYFDDASAGAPMITARGFFGGGENEYVKLLVDGIPAGDVDSGLIDWRHIRVADIERIEVLRGPGSSLYGDSAIGGVISVFTRGATGDDHGELRLSGGTLGTRDFDVFYRGDAGPLRDATGLSGLIDWLAERPSSNPVTIARMIAGSALAREESRGAHVRVDFPRERPSYDHHLPCPELHSTV